MSEDFSMNVSEQSAHKAENDLFLLTERLKADAQAAMGIRFYEITLNNFGEAGEDRPDDWEMLSAAYSRRVGRPHATLEVSGALKEAIQLDKDRPEGATVSVDDGDVPYASVHQWGGERMPARPYFPLNPDGSITDYTQAECEEAAAKAVERGLRDAS